MAFLFTDDQTLFADNVRRFLSDKSNTAAVRAQMATEQGFDPAVWAQITDQLALTGMHLPEEAGGAGFGGVELGIACEEFGRALYCGPFVSSAVLTAYALLMAADPEQKELWLTGIAAGTLRGALAVTEHDTLWQARDINTTATSDDNGHYRLNGSKQMVIDGHTADLLIVVAKHHEQIGFFAVEPKTPGMNISLLPSMDPTRKLTRIDFADVPAQRLNHGQPEHLQRLLDVACIALANEMLGGTQQLFESAVNYTKMRYQFGRSIASFQAIKHRLADLLLELELARSAAYQAAQTLGQCGMLTNLSADLALQLSEHASLAKALLSETYIATAKECIQLHGGIGFTWENDTHLWFKRAKSSEMLFGSPSQHRERMLSALQQRNAAAATSGATN